MEKLYLVVWKDELDFFSSVLPQACFSGCDWQTEEVNKLLSEAWMDRRAGDQSIFLPSLFSFWYFLSAVDILPVLIVLSLPPKKLLSPSKENELPGPRRGGQALMREAETLQELVCACLCLYVCVRLF